MNTKNFFLTTLLLGLTALLLLTGCAQSIADAAPARHKLPGTWHVIVGESVNGFPGFEAYHTFNADGTMTEVSSLLPTLTESPAHGVWAKDRDEYDATFELFAFNEAGELDIRIRVRMTVTVDSDDHFSGVADVDLLLPDGTVEKGVDSSSVEGTRVLVEGAG
ncbi:MAG TPA: hypothetical protein VI451_22015 [Anaerolineales bacterium]|nr:hypothetical protein [Anaerolineales bacterium]